VGVIGQAIHSSIFEGFMGHALMVHGWLVPWQGLVNSFYGFWLYDDLCTPNVAIHVANIFNNAKISQSNNHNINNNQISFCAS
jgi:hypothetical protein